VISDSDHGAQTRQRRWDRVSWWYSLILLIPIIGFLITAGFPSVDGNAGLNGTVRDAYSGSPVSGAEISAAGVSSTSNGSGDFTVPDSDATALTVSRDDYESTQVTVTPGTDRVEVQLRPTTLKGRVTNERTRNPVEGATVVVVGEGDAMVTAITDSDGRYALTNVPRDAKVTVQFEGFSGATQDVGRNHELDFAIHADVVTGLVTDQDGAPLKDATVQIGTVVAVTGEDGTYRLAGVPSAGTITVKKSGYREAHSDLSDDMRFDASLDRFVVKSLYATALTVANTSTWEGLLEIADQTEINAMVVDLKDSSGQVFFDTNVQMAHDIGAVNELFDPAEKLEDLNERGMYSIARIVVFEDPILAEHRRDLAIKNVETGEPWTTWEGLAWVNAHKRDVWDYNIALAVEAANLGFDEIQLDYIRFPTDGLLNLADIGSDYAGETKAEAITEFLRQMRDALAPTGAYLAVDIFGFTLWEESDGGIGQQLEMIEPYVDVINPMIYPSHFHPGAMGFDIPNNHPYEVILWSLQSGAERIGDKSHKFRPWLQDFSYGVGIDYGADELRAQIQASEDFGASGWLVWNAANVFSTEAFARE
jgi:hypothetical protein